jgi:hypothetical protein
METIKSVVVPAVIALAVIAGFTLMSKGDLAGAPGVNLTPTMGFENTITLAPTAQSQSYALSHFESGSTVLVSASGTTTTLPVAKNGLVYRFIVSGAIDTNDWIIESYEGDNIEGTLIVAGAVVDCEGEDQINIVVDGENVGDFVEFRASNSKWFITQSGALTASKMTCTDPS